MTGRPRRVPDEPSTERVVLMLTPSEKAALESRAAAAGQRLAAYLRDLIDGGLADEGAPPAFRCV